MTYPDMDIKIMFANPHFSCWQISLQKNLFTRKWMNNPYLYTTLVVTNLHLMRLGVRMNLQKHFVLGIIYNVQSYYCK